VKANWDEADQIIETLALVGVEASLPVVFEVEDIVPRGDLQNSAWEHLMADFLKVRQMIENLVQVAGEILSRAGSEVLVLFGPEVLV